MADKDEFFIAKNINNGSYYFSGAEKTARAARNTLSDNMHQPWDVCRKLGWRVVKVRLVEVGK